MGLLKRRLIRSWVPTGDNALVAPYVGADDASQQSALSLAQSVLAARANDGRPLRVVDLGSGAGESFRALGGRPGVEWIGVDIEGSPESRQGRGRGLDIRYFDGVEIPLEDASVDLIYSRQVFEHVDFPERLLASAFRKLKPGGAVVGSTSQLEPFHSRSMLNYTPYGFAQLLERAGFRKVRLAPGIDGLTVTVRRLAALVGQAGRFDGWFERESPLNRALELGLRLRGAPPQQIACMKLLFAGHFVFSAEKHPPERPPAGGV